MHLVEALRWVVHNSQTQLCCDLRIGAWTARCRVLADAKITMSSAETRSIRRIRSEVCFWQCEHRRSGIDTYYPVTTPGQRTEQRGCTTNQVQDTARGRPRKREIERDVLRHGIRHVIDRCDLRVLIIHPVA
jgi:hypothetical protein